MSEAQQPTTPVDRFDRFDRALAAARLELARPLPDPERFEQATGETGAAAEALERALAARFIYPGIRGRAAQVFGTAQGRLRRVERRLARRRRHLRLRLLWRRIRRVIAWMTLGLMVLALLGTLYHYRAEIRGWVEQMLPTPAPAQQNAPQTPAQPQTGTGGTRP